MKLLKNASMLALCLLGSSLTLTAQTPSFTRDASVHDPSVIKVGDRFYVYGSHGASAYTEDLMNWTQVAVSMTSGNPVHFTSWKTTLSELVEWTTADTLWAADVYQLDDGKYYYYYNVWTDYLSYRSYMGVAVSDTIEGPYTNVGEILKGGTNVAGFDPAYDPNTIDPTLYRDTEDNLWMVYGSYSGGIFVLEMDDTTGLQKPGQEWGTKLLDGRYGSMEGPFMEYNEDTGYYYLFLSFGGLAAADGYQMRVFRSQSPNGPFYDPSGTDMSTASSSTWTQNGLKLAGGWQFNAVDGEANQSPTGYLSPGHNSVMKDPASGKWFNFFHTRFVDRGEAHEVRVHQLFFNEDGWPVMAPHRYAGETQGSYSVADVSGSYKVINHGKDVTREAIPKYATVIGLAESGGLSGASGSWELVDGQNIRITMDDVLYKGVVCEQWDNENSMWVMGFTAVSPDGVAIWGSEVAIADRTGDLDPPVLAQIDDTALAMGESLDLVLTNLAPNSELTLVYKILQGPEGLEVDSLTGAITWTPLVSQMGQAYPVQIQVYDLIDPSLMDEVNFSVYASGGYEFEELFVDFTSAGSGGILDNAGKSTGLTARLSGTGTSYSSNDPNLTLDEENGHLTLASTETDFNGQAGVAAASAVGLKLSEIGYTGAEDFSVRADFGPIEGLENVDQVGVFVGSSATTLTRAGIFQGTAAQGLGVHTQNGTDESATFELSTYDLSDGLTVTIAREAGEWSYLVDGVVVNPQSANATFLDALSDLTVGVFAINPLNTNSKTVAVESLRVAVLSDQPRETLIQKWRTENFGASPAEGVAGNSDDPDGDGRSNLVEYALGTNPLVADGDPNWKVEVVDGKLVWTISQIEDPALTYEVRASETPALTDSELVWRSGAGNNQAGPVEVDADLPSGYDAKLFMQLSVDTIED
ncbi:glycoside hydrolase family 43 protein [Pelagicoccus albus]|uniref:Glycoside hydrolase family 43 protein n=1 Tax=Pelagicoccus albus TaxID=415222 RepID=A0A7X1E8W0_9BACT|nr:glycoside hydrolase family 43 protein [Pelagicoccus albus]MBC2606726.1 glycoside hydrolase family 43 protein [Pelagicoccus albus]